MIFKTASLGFNRQSLSSSFHSLVRRSRSLKKVKCDIGGGRVT